MKLKVNEISASKINCESIQSSAGSSPNLFNANGCFIPRRLDSDGDAPSNSIFYSNTESALCYKDPSGTIYEFSLVALEGGGIKDSKLSKTSKNTKK